MAYCSECGAELNDEDKFCKECGAENPIKPEAEKKEKINPYTGYPEKEVDKETEKDKWPKNLSIGLGVWGVLNIFFAWLFGAILIFFAVLIYASKSYKAIYAFGVVYLLIALVQLILGILLTGSTFVSEINQGYVLIVVSIINLAIGGYVINKTRKLDEQ